MSFDYLTDHLDVGFWVVSVTSGDPIACPPDVESKLEVDAGPAPQRVLRAKQGSWAKMEAYGACN